MRVEPLKVTKQSFVPSGYQHGAETSPDDAVGMTANGPLPVERSMTAIAVELPARETSTAILAPFGDQVGDSQKVQCFGQLSGLRTRRSVPFVRMVQSW